MSLHLAQNISSHRIQFPVGRIHRYARDYFLREVYEQS